METSKIDHDIRTGGSRGPKKPRYKNINIRLNNVEHNRVMAIAYEQGKSVSDMARHYLHICLDAYEKEFGSVAYKGSPDNHKIKTVAEVTAETIKADNQKIKDGWTEAERIVALKVQVRSPDKVISQAAKDVFDLRRAEKAANIPNNS